MRVTSRPKVYRLQLAVPLQATALFAYVRHSHCVCRLQRKFNRVEKLREGRFCPCTRQSQAVERRTYTTILERIINLVSPLGAVWSRR